MPLVSRTHHVTEEEQHPSHKQKADNTIEIENPHDHNAVLVLLPTKTEPAKLGHLEKTLAKAVAKLMDRPRPVNHCTLHLSCLLSFTECA